MKSHEQGAHGQAPRHLTKAVGRAAIALVSLVLGGIANAQDGEVLYATCATCHGADGAGNVALGAPAIAGQLESYLVRQLSHFRAGIRGAAEGDQYGAQMAPFATQLADDAAVAAVAAYVAALKPAASDDTISGDTRKGASLYNGNCGACHGGSGEGNESLNAPRLAGLGSTYLKRQFANYGSGIRGAHADDRLGRQMAMMAKTLPDETALNDVIAYIQSLETPKAKAQP